MDIMDKEMMEQFLLNELKKDKRSTIKERCQLLYDDFELSVLNGKDVTNHIIMKNNPVLGNLIKNQMLQLKYLNHLNHLKSKQRK